MRRHIATIFPLFLLLFEIGFAAAVPFETTVSQRCSVRSYTDNPVTSEQLLTLLRAGYGYSGANRVLPKIGNAYSLTIFSIDSSGSHVYTPETNSISVWDTNVTKDTISPHLTQSWENDANVVVLIVWDQTKMNNKYFAWAEAGCFVQNYYLAAVNSGLGTTCAQTFNATGLRLDLNLPTTMTPLLIMPTGFPLQFEYPPATPDYTRMDGNLPTFQSSGKSFEDTLGNVKYTQTWSNQPLSLQETSQLLWAAYGYSSTGHRTTPSWGAWYPLLVYMANATGTYRYLPESHSVTQIKTGDSRVAIASACGNQAWAATAPAIFLIAYNSSVNTEFSEPGWYDLSVEVDAGCVVQQILLESSAMSLSANVVTNGFDFWNGTTAQSIRENLNIESSTVPLYILPVGHVSSYPTPTSSPTPPPTESPTSTPSASPTPTSPASPSQPPTSTPSPSPSPPSDSPVLTVLLIAVPSIILLTILSFFMMKKRNKTKQK